MKKVVEMWNKLKLWHQILLVLAVIGIAFAVFLYSNKPAEYNLLFSKLDAKEAIEIGNELSTMGVDYTLEENNTTIMVKTADVATVRMKLASKGLPSTTGPGFELFDGSNLGTSSFENSVNYTRALQGNIQKTLIRGVEDIESAEVQIPLIEKKRFFEKENEPLEAKVIVKEKAGRKLTPEQVKGIQNFVAGAAKNMKPEHVTVMNGNAEVISDNTDDGSGNNSAAYSKQRQIVNQTEERIRQDIMKTLSTVFGYDNIRVTVRADINFDEIVRNIEKYDPEGTMVSRQNKKEKVREETKGQKEAGTESNGDVVDYELGADNGKGTSSQDKEEIIENFEVGKTVETIRKNPELQNLLVSVYVDEQQISVNKLEDLRESVAFSAGLIDKDGDKKFENGDISVKTYEFKKDEEVIKPKDNEPKGFEGFVKDNKVLLIVLGVLFLIVVVLVILLAYSSVKRKKAIEQEAKTLAKEGRSEQEEEMTKTESYTQEEMKETEPESNESKMKKKLMHETLHHAKENKQKTIEYLKKSLNER